MILRNSSLFCCLLLAVALPATAATQDDGADAAGLLSLDDFGKARGARSVAVSPDGRLVAYAADDQIHVVSYDGGEPRAITTVTSQARSPRWSDDGSALFFLSDRSGTGQLWKLPVASFGEAIQVTDIEQGVSAIRLSPDETRLLLTIDPGEPEPSDGPREEPWVIDRLQFKADYGEGYLTRRPAEHIYVHDLEAGELRPITSGEHTEDEPAWSPDGKRIVFVSNREAEPDALYKNDVWLVPADNPGSGSTLTRLTDDDHVKSSPRFTPDGKSVVYLAATDGVYGQSELAIVPVSGGEPRMLTRRLDRWIWDYQFSKDGRHVYFSYEDEGAVQLGRLQLNSGEIETLTTGPIAISSFAVSPAGRIAVTAAAESRASEVYRVERGKLVALTALNADFFAARSLGSKTSVDFASKDGTRVQAFITTPPGYEPGRRYPTILKIHGGPVGQFSWGYDFGTQFFAAKGYVVVEPNPRGSSGRGQDFIRAIYRTWGITDYDDVIAAVDYAIDAGIADPSRLAVTGYSYGGYMTNVVITRTERFKAAASGAGHSFIAANFGHDIYQKWYNWELGPPWEYPERYEPLSPLLDVAKVQTPTIFLGGRIDWNVPILNAELFYQSLKVRGVDTRLVVYPDAHHGGWPEAFDKDYLERVLGWFDVHLNREAGQKSR